MKISSGRISEPLKESLFLEFSSGLVFCCSFSFDVKYTWSSSRNLFMLFLLYCWFNWGLSFNSLNLCSYFMNLPSSSSGVLLTGLQIVECRIQVSGMNADFVSVKWVCVCYTFTGFSSFNAFKTRSSQRDVWTVYHSRFTSDIDSACLWWIHGFCLLQKEEIISFNHRCLVSCEWASQLYVTMCWCQHVSFTNCPFLFSPILCDWI